MEELSLRYTKILIGFLIVMSLSTVTIKNHIKSVTNARKTAQAMLDMEEAVQRQAEMQNTNVAKQEPSIRQVRIADKQPQEDIQQQSQEQVQQPQETQQVEQNVQNIQQPPREKLYEKEGLKRMAQGDIDNAILYLEYGFKIGDNEFKKSTSKYLIQCYEQKGDIAGLINTYNRLLEVEEDVYEKRNINEKLADYFIQSGNKEQALSYYEQNYALTNSSSDLTRVCDMLMELNQKEKMRNYLYDYLARNPQDGELFKKYTDFLISENTQG